MFVMGSIVHSDKACITSPYNSPKSVAHRDDLTFVKYNLGQLTGRSD